MSTQKTVSAILAVSDERIRYTMAESFVRSRYPFYRRAASDVIYTAHRRRDVGDIVQLIALEEFSLLTADVSEGDALEVLGNWDAIIRSRARKKVSKYFASSEYHGFAEITGRTRRHIEVSRVAAEKEGSGMSPEEIVAETNRRLEDRLADVDRQGMRCTLSDFYEVGQVYIDEREHSQVYESGQAEEPLLDAVDAPRLIADIISRAHGISPDHGAVAEEWIGRSHPEGDISSPREISHSTGLDAYTVEKILAEVRQEAIISASMVAGISVYQALGMKDAAAAMR